MTSEISNKQLLDKVSFVKWKNAVEAIHDYVNKKVVELNEMVEEKKIKCDGIIKELGDEYKPEVGVVLTLEKFKRYVELHKQLRNIMLAIQSDCKKVHHEINIVLNDCMKLIDQRTPLYSKFVVPSKEASGEKSSVFIMVVVALIFLFSIILTSYSIMEDYELNAILTSLKFKK